MVAYQLALRISKGNETSTNADYDLKHLFNTYQFVFYVIEIHLKYAYILATQKSYFYGTGGGGVSFKALVPIWVISSLIEAYFEEFPIKVHVFFSF